MKYGKIRREAGLSLYTIQKRLGLTREQAKKLDKGNLELSGEYVDKFQEIINNASILKLELSQKMIEVNEWFETGKCKEDMSAYNYNNSCLAKALGVNGSGLSRYMNNKGKSDETKEMIFDFLHNPINKCNEKPVRRNYKKELPPVTALNIPEAIEVKSEVIEKAPEINEELKRYIQLASKMEKELQFYKETVARLTKF